MTDEEQGAKIASEFKAREVLRGMQAEALEFQRVTGLSSTIPMDPQARQCAKCGGGKVGMHWCSGDRLQGTHWQEMHGSRWCEQGEHLHRYCERCGCIPGLDGYGRGE